ncbi:MAG: DUF4276 family protein [Planctomycetota bacterium]
MHIEFLLEEPSAEAALKNLLPRILPAGWTWRFHVYHGKMDLLHKLPQRLAGYAYHLSRHWRIVVLVDEDREDCHALKARLEGAAREAGLATKSDAGGGRAFRVMNRIVVEELEAWYFGDVQALEAAYPRLPKNLASRRPYLDPDAVPGGTWEALERELRRAGYYRGGLRKIEAARRISAHMVPERNRSRSFQVFCEGLLSFL